MVRKVIRIEQGLVRPETPRTATVRAKRLRIPTPSQGHQEAAGRLSSPLLMGPPICDELIALVEHTFREDEAEVVGALSGVHSRNAAQVAARTGRPRDEAREILDGLADGKRAITSVGSGSERRFRLLPIMPGIFEMVLISEAPDTMSAWHRRFAELVEALFETGIRWTISERLRLCFVFFPSISLRQRIPRRCPRINWRRFSIVTSCSVWPIANAGCLPVLTPRAAAVPWKSVRRWGSSPSGGLPAVGCVRCLGKPCWTSNARQKPTAW